MKRSILLFLLSFSTFAFEVGVVDMNKTLLALKDGQQVKKTLERMASNYEGQLKEKELELLKMSENYQKQQAILSDEAKKKKEEDLYKKQLELQELDQKAKRELVETEKKLMEPIFAKLEKVIKKVADKEELDLTVTKENNPFISIKDPKNITEKVIKAYEK